MNSLFYKKNKYILDCDFLSKNLIKSTYCIPSINSVLITFSASDVCDKKIYPAKVFLVFYLLFSNLSFIKTHKSSKNLFYDTSFVDNSCDFQVTLSNKNSIHQFLFDFIETKALLQKKTGSLLNINFVSKETKSFLIFSSKKKDPLLSMYGSINFNINFNLKNFFEITNTNVILKNILL